jgi:hypothetical protein
MSIYELRIYTLHVGRMPEAFHLYEELGYPAMKKSGYDKKLVGYFQSDTGLMNQLIHLWKFDDDADRRAHWKEINTDSLFREFAVKFRPLVLNIEVKLLLATPWGCHP